MGNLNLWAMALYRNKTLEIVRDNSKRHPNLSPHSFASGSDPYKLGGCTAYCRYIRAKFSGPWQTSARGGNFSPEAVRMNDDSILADIANIRARWVAYKADLDNLKLGIEAWRDWNSSVVDYLGSGIINKVGGDKLIDAPFFFDNSDNDRTDFTQYEGEEANGTPGMRTTRASTLGEVFRQIEQFNIFESGTNQVAKQIDTNKKKEARKGYSEVERMVRRSRSNADTTASALSSIETKKASADSAISDLDNTARVIRARVGEAHREITRRAEEAARLAEERLNELRNSNVISGPQNFPWNQNPPPNPNFDPLSIWRRP